MPPYRRSPQAARRQHFLANATLNHAFPPALCVLAASLLGNLATPPTTLWDDKPVKQKWSATPSNWELPGHPPAGTTIDLHIVPKPHSENYEVSNPRHPKYDAYLDDPG
ncbi:hypothetical protein EDB84DRAFT_1444201 [Lactarius hengduanensis]|nr:hypothetical protein EDB84DRAFT_1444201 [Lactarius hengduanensis]